MTRKKVFCIGLGKTGTTSLKEALRQLDYRTIRLPLNWQGITDFDAGSRQWDFTHRDKVHAHRIFGFII